MIYTSIYPNTTLIIDHSLTARCKKIVTALVAECFTLIRLIKSEKIILRVYNDKHADILVKEPLALFGVTMTMLHGLNNMSEK